MKAHWQGHEFEYSAEDEEAVLEELVEDMGSGELLMVPGVYEALSEHLNNDIIDKLAERKGVTDLEYEDKD